VRTLARTLATTGVLAIGLVGAALAAPSAAQSAPSGDDCSDEVRVAEVSGLLDPVLIDFVEESVTEADACGAVAIVLQINSSGAIVDDDRMDDLIELLDEASIPVTAWVGPAGSQARNAAFRLVEVADVAALAPESRLQAPGGRAFGSEEAVEADLTDLGGRQAATLGDFIVSLSDFDVDVEVREIPDGDEIRREPVTRTRFDALGLVDQLAHTVASPPVAYLLFVIGMALLLFELYTAGVGVAGVVGATFMLLGAYGLSVLPTNAFAVGLLVFSMFGFGIDVQTGVPRVWTGIASVSYLLGSVFLYDGQSLSWITLLISVLGMVLAMLGGMPAMVRSRFSTPTIGREWMVGEEGVASTAVDPDGTVLVRDAPWKARTNRGTPIPAGDPVRVASIEGLVLEVEPLEGAARDHRERRQH
jgi:membrane-bound serine protease (ClpP class)